MCGLNNKLNSKIGILGGGQLGKMLFEAGSPLNINYSFIEAKKDCPAHLVCKNLILGSLQDEEKIKELAAKSDVISFEIEHVNVGALQRLEEQGKKIIPQPGVLSVIQDKGLQKQFYKDHNIPTLDFQLAESKSLLEEVNKWSDDKFVLKHRKGGYDGKGVQLLDKQRFRELQSNGDEGLSSPDGYVLERLAKNAVEVSVIVAVGQDGEQLTYPPCEMVFDPKSNLMDYLIAPSSLDNDINSKCETIALKAINSFKSPGVFAVELFVEPDGGVYVNEIAPRAHNSGHHTIESSYTSQYEQINRVLLGLPLGNSSLLTPAATCNIVGPEDVNGTYQLANLNQVLKISGVYVHMYGKTHTSPDRKLGHFTVLAETRDDVVKKMNKVKALLSIKSN